LFVNQLHLVFMVVGLALVNLRFYSFYLLVDQPSGRIDLLVSLAFIDRVHQLSINIILRSALLVFVLH
jgi:hypothetical protein